MYPIGILLSSSISPYPWKTHGAYEAPPDLQFDPTGRVWELRATRP